MRGDAKDILTADTGAEKAETNWNLGTNSGRIYKRAPSRHTPQNGNLIVCTPGPFRDTGIASFASLIQCKFGAVLVIGLHTCKFRSQWKFDPNCISMQSAIKVLRCHQCIYNVNIRLLKHKSKKTGIASSIERDVLIIQS